MQPSCFEPQSQSETHSTAIYLLRLQTRLLVGDPDAAREIERIAWLSNLEALVADLERIGRLQEHQFTASLPLIGRILASIRSALYRWTAGWPLRVLIAQQNRVNRSIAHALVEQVKINHRLLLRIEQLEARVAELERERQQR